jgi:hypothetical protein
MNWLDNSTAISIDRKESQKYGCFYGVYENSADLRQ